MLRILIAEDEPPLQRALVRMINSSDSSHIIVGTAINGVSALEILEREKVDLVLSDVRMPVMDGLTLAERIRTDYPETHVVIITGYQEFEYVQRALKARVYDFITKPVLSDTLNSLLCRLDEELLSKRKEIKCHMLQEAVQGVPINGNIHTDSVYGLLVAYAGSFPLVYDDSLLPGRSFWIENSVTEIMTPYFLSGEEMTELVGKTSAELVLAFCGADTERIYELGRILESELKNRKTLPVTMVISSELVSITEIKDKVSYLRARVKNEMRFLTGLFLPREPVLTINFPDSEKVSLIIKDAIAKMKSSSFENILYDAVMLIIEEKFTQKEAMNVFLKAVGSQYSGIDDKYLHFANELDSAVSYASSPQSFAADAAFLLSELFEVKAENYDKRAKEPEFISLVEKYMCDHYCESITNTVLSKQFGFVPSYISKLFRTYRGVSPSEYLTSYRIERVKALISEHPDMLFKEAASLVGFNDQHYFSKIFKRETGLWPSEYFAK